MTGIDAFEELIYCATFSPFTPGISTSRKTTSKPKSARGRKKTPQEIREEMLKELEKSKLK